MREILNDLDAAKEILDPEEKARAANRIKHPKRFYEKVTINPAENGFQVLLDGRHVKTPARHTLVLPTKALAQHVADEFSIQEKEIDPAKMPITRLVNTIIDGISVDMQPVFEDVLRFCAADMLFYRAESPKELVERQQQQWDPVLDWAEKRLGACFVLGEGVMHVSQPPEAIAAVSVYLRNVTSPFVLGAIHVMTTLTGSALLALAVADGALNLRNAWQLAHLDEDWTIEHWGEDQEAKTRRAWREAEMVAATAVLAAVKVE